MTTKRIRTTLTTKGITMTTIKKKMMHNNIIMPKKYDSNLSRTKLINKKGRVRVILKGALRLLKLSNTEMILLSLHITSTGSLRAIMESYNTYLRGRMMRKRNLDRIGAVTWRRVRFIVGHRKSPRLNTIAKVILFKNLLRKSLATKTVSNVQITKEILSI